MKNNGSMNTTRRDLQPHGPLDKTRVATAVLAALVAMPAAHAIPASAVSIDSPLTMESTFWAAEMGIPTIHVNANLTVTIDESAPSGLLDAIAVFNQGVVATLNVAAGVVISADGVGLTASGIRTDGATLLTNHGTLSVSSDQYAGFARGVVVQGDGSGALSGTSLTNSDTGLITVAATGSSYANSVGVGITDFGSIDSLVINNSGSIGATSTSSQARGISVRNGGNLTLSGTSSITNFGAITVTTERYAAYGIDVSSDSSLNVSGLTVTNHGSIDVTSEDSGPSAGIRIFAQGVNLSLSDTTITNAGTISATTSNGSASGIQASAYYGGDIRGLSITNLADKSIVVSAGSGWGVGITVNSSYSMPITDSTITNRGLIDVDGDANAIGIEAGTLESYALSAGVTNSGTIDVAARGEQTGAWGVKVSTLSGASITNEASGQILAESHSGDVVGIGAQSLQAVEAESGLLESSITNRGTIMVNAVEGSAKGIEVGYGHGHIENSGTITARIGLGEAAAADFRAYSINAGEGYIDVTNTASGVLNGNLRVSGSLDNHGKVSLPYNAYGDGGSAVWGQFLNGASGTLEIGLLTDGNEVTHSQLYTGTATFEAGSTLAINVLAASTNVELLVGQTLQDVVSTDDPEGLSVEGTLKVIDNSALLNFVAIVDGNTLDLQVVEASTIVDATTAGGGSGNAKSAAGALQTIKDGGGGSLAPVLGALNTLGTDRQIAAAVASFTPGTALSGLNVTQQIAHGIRDLVNFRQNAMSGRGLNSGDAMLSDRNAWFKPFGTWGKQKDVDGVDGFKLNTQGFGLGLDGKLDSGKRVGVAFFYTNADVGVNNVSQSANMDVYSALLYGTVPVLDDKTNVQYQVGYASQHTRSARHMALLNETATASYTTSTTSVEVKLIRDYPLNDQWLVQPSVQLSYLGYRSPQFTEAGSSANLTVDGFHHDDVIVGAGSAFEYKLDPVSKIVGSAYLGYNTQGDGASVRAAFQGSPAVKFQVEGVNNGRWTHELGLGYERRTSETSHLNFLLTHQGAGTKYRNNAISVTYNLKF